MKIKTIICVLLAFQLSVHAQEPKKKPSWTVSMPERDDAPGMKMQIEDEDEDGFGLDRSSLGFDRDELSSTEDENVSQESTSPKMTNKIEIQKQLDNERKKNVAQQEKIKKLEAEKLEQEKIAARKLAEQNAKNQKENQEKLVAQKVAEQETAEQDKTQQGNKLKEEIKQKQKSTQPSSSSYKWKKTKNIAPAYPSKAARKKIEGWVDIEITIDSTGKVVAAYVIRSKRGAHIFDKSALRAVKQWKYEAPSNYGVNTNLKKTIRMVYKL